MPSRRLRRRPGSRAAGAHRRRRPVGAGHGRRRQRGHRRACFRSPAATWPPRPRRSRFRGRRRPSSGRSPLRAPAAAPTPAASSADSDGDGGSFHAQRAVRRGRDGHRHTSLNIAGGHGGIYRFTVATPAGAIRAAAPMSAPRVRGDVERFASAPQLFARPEVTKLPTKAAPARRLFVAPQAGPVQRGPEILGPYGGLVWFKPVPAGRVRHRLPRPELPRPPVLTWWQGNDQRRRRHRSGRDLQQLTTARSPPSRPATACARTCTSSSSPRRTPRWSPPTTRCTGTRRGSGAAPSA